jgi:hypothetical protein
VTVPTIIVGFAGKGWIVRSMSHLIHNLSSLQCLSSLVQLLGTASRYFKEIFCGIHDGVSHVEYGLHIPVSVLLRQCIIQHICNYSD